jgi:uncharacterized protein YndB with AHSA1/START domain
MNHSINHLFHIDSPQGDVFKALTTIDGLSKWWTQETSGKTSKGEIIKFRFGSHGGPDMKVSDIIPNESVTWECIDSPHGWVGHTLTFKLDRNDNKTRIRFTHDGWKDADDFYASCTFTWGRYMESLRQLCQTGKGEGFGNIDYRK